MEYVDVTAGMRFQLLVTLTAAFAFPLHFGFGLVKDAVRRPLEVEYVDVGFGSHLQLLVIWIAAFAFALPFHFGFGLAKEARRDRQTALEHAAWTLNFLLYTRKTLVQEVGVDLKRSLQYSSSQNLMLLLDQNSFEEY